MKRLDYTIINKETGEIFDLKDFIKKDNSFRITKQMVDFMLEQANSSEEIDTELLAKWVKITKLINGYGQIKLSGCQRNVDIEKKMIKEGMLYVYVAKIMYATHPFSCAIMLNRQTKVRSWKELWDLIDCKSRPTQIKIKKFLTENSLVRELVVYEGSRKKSKNFYLNPFLLRTSGYASQVAINCFKDCAKEGINLNSYAYRFLQCVGILDFHK